MCSSIFGLILSRQEIEMAEDSVHSRFNLDEAFSFVFDNSSGEPVTPYRVCFSFQL